MFIDSSQFETINQHPMLDFQKGYISLLNNKSKGILTATMLTSLVIHDRFVSDVYNMENIANMKCQLQNLHPEKYLIKPKQDKNFQHLCFNYCVCTSLYICAYIEVSKLSIIQYYIILSSTTFQLGTMTNENCSNLC